MESELDDNFAKKIHFERPFSKMFLKRFFYKIKYFACRQAKDNQSLFLQDNSGNNLLPANNRTPFVQVSTATMNTLSLTIGENLPDPLALSPPFRNSETTAC